MQAPVTAVDMTLVVARQRAHSLLATAVLLHQRNPLAMQGQQQQPVRRRHDGLVEVPNAEQPEYT